jgi:hypothetical protein
MYYDDAKDMRLGRAKPSRKEIYKEMYAEPPSYGSPIETKVENRISIMELQSILWKSLGELHDSIRVLEDRIHPVLTPVDGDGSIASVDPKPHSIIVNELINMNEYIGNMIEKVNNIRGRSEV